MIPQNRNPDSRGNTGASYLPEIGRWETYLLTTYGGFTRLPACHGAWRDPKTGTIYRDAPIPYQIALTNQWDIENVTARALRIFDDQKAIYVTNLGVSHVVERAEEAA